MKQVILEEGAAKVIEVPAPGVPRRGAVVRVTHSVISTGTERANLESTAESALEKARRRPDLALQVLRAAAHDGIALTAGRVRERLREPVATGYSCAGLLTEVGEETSGLRPGQRVACAGSQWAWHAEYVAVPRNLICAVPDGVSLGDAASVAIGAIALQGVRQGAVELGHRVVVSGLGVIGLLTVQIARAAGARVLAVDPQPSRRALALELGAARACAPEDVEALVSEETDGFGADRTLICAATPSDEPIRQAMRVTRKRGIVVVIGDVGLALTRSPFYEREIELRIACSYGPGRYDPSYEEDGLDYPAAWVRWTEQRNMAAYLELLASGTVRWAPLVAAEYPADDAGTAFARLKEPSPPIALSLRFADPDLAPPPAPSRSITRSVWATGSAGTVRLGIIGAGSYTRSVHLPMLRRLGSRFLVTGVANRTGVRAAAAARQAGAGFVTTDYRALLERPDVDAVLIATRHSAHARLAAEALQAGKHVFLEKPAAVSQSELDLLLPIVGDVASAFLVGYNRRFSRAADLLRAASERHGTPPVFLYRVNADPGGPTDWTHAPDQGGRAIGEACHMVDFLQAVIDHPLEGVTVSCAPQATRRDANFSVALRFANGALATLVYTTQGAKGLPKERVEAFCGGEVFVLDDFRALSRLRGAWSPRWRETVTKGHEEIWRAFHAACTTGPRLPIPIADLRSVAEATFRIHREALG